MSLNWTEIDKIIGELQLPGSHIQKIQQPDFQSLLFECYRPGDPFTLFISLTSGETRLHRISDHPPGGVKLQRFAQFLRSRIKGGRITEAIQIGRERIVKIRIVRGGETTLLYVKLWGGAANIIATDSNGLILDAYYRRPGKKEVTGNVYDPAEEKTVSGKTTGKTSDTRFSIRAYDGHDSFNRHIERYYREKKDISDVTSLRAQALRFLEKQENAAEILVEQLQDRLSEYDGFEKYRQYGELIISNLYRIKQGDEKVVAENYYEENQPVEIELDPALSPDENGERYFKRYKKAKSGREIVRRDLKELQEKLSRIRFERSQITEETPGMELSEQKKPDPDTIIERCRSILARKESMETDFFPGKGAKDTVSGPRSTRQEIPLPGLRFLSGPFTILAGRNARENDALLRRHVKGNDYWLHTRDYPGGYIFIKAIPGKSVPLETLLDAGNLALWYSKGKSGGEGDLYYTKVKYLRRAKGEKTGTVLPTQEKNITIKLDEKRLARLLRKTNKEIET